MDKLEDLVDPTKLALEHFKHMLLEIRRTRGGANLKGTPCQIASLIGAALQIVDPDGTAAYEDAGFLEIVFNSMATDLQKQDGGDIEYDDISCQICGGEVEDTEDDRVCISCKEDAIDDDDEPDDPSVSPWGPSDRTFDEGPN